MNDEKESTSRRKSKIKTRLIVIFKFIISIGLCYVLITQANWNQAIDSMRSLDKWLVLLVFILLILSVTISAYKWKILLSIHEVKYSFSILHKYYFIAMYFNNFLPTSIGGDGYRIYKTINNKRSKSSAVLAVLMERITGILALLFLGFVSAIMMFLENRDEISRIYIIIGVVSISIASVVLLLILTTRIFNGIIHSNKWPNKIKTFIEHFIDYRSEPKRLLYVILISFIFQLHNSLPFYLLLLSGADEYIAFYQLLIVLALVNIIGILPISINGLGVTDGAFIYLAGLYGVPFDNALVTMLLIRVMLVPISIIGAIFYFFDKKTIDA